MQTALFLADCLVLKLITAAYFCAETFIISLSISAEHFIPVICCFIRLMFLIIAGICLILHFNVAVDSAAIARFKGNLSGGGLSLKGQWKSIGERSDKKLRVGAKMGEHPVQPLADTAMRNAHFPGNFST